MGIKFVNRRRQTGCISYDVQVDGTVIGRVVGHRQPYTFWRFRAAGEANAWSDRFGTRDQAAGALVVGVRKAGV